MLTQKSDRNINCTNDTETMLTKVPDIGVVVDVIVVLLIVLLVEPVAVCPVVVVSGTVDDVRWGDSVVVVIGVDSVTGSFQTYVNMPFASALSHVYSESLCFVH